MALGNGGPEAIGLEKVAEILSGVTGRRVTYVDIPLDEARRTMTREGLPDWLADDLRKLYEIFSAGRGAKVSPCVEDITGRAPRDFERFLHDYAETFIGELVHH
ncbi:MAG: hypothetical protein HZB29_03980 [Nitrospinae bacterium]|nr:hypothetical protein [Nitrospinota bacterium]